MLFGVLFQKGGIAIKMELVFADYIKTIQRGLKKHDGDKAAVEFLSTPLLDPRRGYDHYFDATEVSRLLSRKNSVPDALQQASTDNQISVNVLKYFNDSVVKELNPHLEEDVLQNLLTLVKTDQKISERKRQELIEYYNEDDLGGFLAFTFMYVLNRENKKLDEEI